MKKIILVVFVLLTACSKHHDQVFTSAAGNWTYTSPDSEVTVTFQLVANSDSGLDIQNYTIKLDGVLYNAYGVITGVTLPATIQKIHINANDSKANYAYDVEFDNCVVSADFKTITAATGFYTWPYNKTNNLTSIKITRAN